MSRHSSPANASSRWTVAGRLAAEWKLKLAGIPGFLGLFFGAYFLLLRFPLFPVTTIPLTAWDRWIPFQPAALGLYFSLWVYVSLEPSLAATRGELGCFLKSAAALAVGGLAFFFFWPTATPVPADIVWADHPGFVFLKEVDRAQNACPSLHVAFAVFAFLRLRPLLSTLGAGFWLRVVSGLWCVGIIYSTLATRQHVLIDVAAGAVLGVIAARFSLRKRRYEFQREALARADRI